MTGYPDDDATKRADRLKRDGESGLLEREKLKGELEAARRYPANGDPKSLINRRARRRAAALHRRG